MKEINVANVPIQETVELPPKLAKFCGRAGSMPVVPICEGKETLRPFRGVVVLSSQHLE